MLLSYLLRSQASRSDAVRALGLAIRIADNLAVVAYGYKDGLPRAYADNYVEFSATQRVGWVEPLRNPSCFVIG